MIFSNQEHLNTHTIEVVETLHGDLQGGYFGSGLLGCSASFADTKCSAIGLPLVLCYSVLINEIYEFI